MKPAALAGRAAGVAIPAYPVYLRDRRDMNAARARLAAVDSALDLSASNRGATSCSVDRRAASRAERAAF
jgi:hypothetical protein